MVFVFAILTIAPLISESLVGNSPGTMAILQKCMGAPFHHKLVQYH